MRIVLADDHPLFREGISLLLQSRGYQVVGQADDGLEAVKLADQQLPDLVIMDVFMPRLSGIEATRTIKEKHPEIKIVMLTISDDEEELFDALRSGADGYLLKDLRAKEFFDLLRGISKGEAPISRRLASRLVNEFVRSGEYEPHENLTKREWDVLHLVAEGLTNAEIAKSLYITENTVKFHLKNILAKLHLRNRSAAVAWAAKQKRR